MEYSEKINIEGLSFKYGKRQILKDINLDLERGSLVAVLGPNGSGKSTLVKCSNGLLRSYQGQVRIKGRDLKEMSHKEISSLIGYVPQNYQTNFSITVLESILMGLDRRSNWTYKREELERAEKIILEMGLEDIAHQDINRLSGGQLQKVTIARAVIKNPPFIFMDEPTSGLDIKSQRDLMFFMKDLAHREKMGILAVVHDINLAAELADVIVMMKDGRIIDKGPVEKVLNRANLKTVFQVDTEIIEHLNKPHVLIV